MLSKEAIEKFQHLFEKSYGKKISFEEAQLQGTRLVELLRTVYGQDIKILLKKRERR